MGISTTARLRAMGLVFLALAFWQSRVTHQGLFHGAWAGLPIGLMILWVVTLFGVSSPRLTA